MKRKNRILILLMIFTLMLLLASCRSNGTIPREEVARQQFKEELETLQRLAKGQTNEVKVKEDKVYLIKKSIVENLETGKKYVKRIEKYDDKNNLLSLVSNRKNGELFYYEKYQYNDEGEVMKSTILREPFGAITRTYSYDKQGKKMGYLETNEKGEKCGEGLYKYYDSGQLKYQYTNDQYTKKTKEIYYNESGEKTKKINSNLMADSTSYFEYEYDDKGNKIKEVESKKYEANGMVIKIITYYNQFNKCKKYIVKSGQEVSTWFEYEYDKNGNEIKFISKDKDGDIQKIRLSEYNKIEKKIKDLRKSRDEQGEFWIFLWVEYEYDKEGNRIKEKYKDQNGEITSIKHILYEKN